MAFIIVLTALFAVLAGIAAAQRGIFESPCEESADRNFSRIDTFSLNSETQIRWNTNISSYSILLMQESTKEPGSAIGPTVYQKLDGQPEEGEFDWTIQVKAPLDLSKSPVYYLSLYPTGEDYPEFMSCYFNITDTASSSSVTSEPTATSSSGSRPSATSTEEPASNDSSNATKIGLGVGLGVGIPLIIAAIVGTLFWRRRAKNAAVNDQSNGGYGAVNLNPPQVYPQDTVKYAYQDASGGYGEGNYGQQPPPSELPSNSMVHELHGGPGGAPGR